MSEHQERSISAIVTFHKESLLAHKTLLGLERVRAYAEQRGLDVEYVLVLDRADAETSRVVASCPVVRASDRLLHVENGDPGVSRNDGVTAASGAYVGIFDGDDLYSENWLYNAWAAVQGKVAKVVVHPDYVVSYGAVHSVGRMLDMERTPDYSLSSCFSVHPWVCSSFVSRALYLQHPYVRADSARDGFGFEDWHWNLEMLAAGVRHVAAPQTALFYRRKSSSVLSNHLANGVLVRPSKFFERPGSWGTPQSANDVLHEEGAA